MSAENADRRVATSVDNGWNASAAAYIAFQDRGDPHRTLLLDPVMLDLCGDVNGRRVLDVGCGEGRFGRMLADRGARVTGLDATPQMIHAAKHRAHAATWLVSAGEHVPFRDATFDLCVSYISLVDISGYAEAIGDMSRVLRPEGHLVVANLGFITASPGWMRDETGRRLHRPIDRYVDEWPQTLEWAGMRVVSWHRPLSSYMRAYLSAGLILRDFLEPVPSDETLRAHPDYEDWFRVSEFTVMKWQKPASRA